MLRDMLTQKQKVKDALQKISVVFERTVEEFWKQIKMKREGSGSFIGIWAPGCAPSVQCDALAYIGPRQFKKFALPFIKKDLKQADYGTYHLDGPDALKFVHDLLEIPDLDLIQWVHGAGNPDGVALKWYPLVKRVLKAGKRIMLYTGPDKVPFFIKKLKKDGIDPGGVVFNLGEVREFEIEQFLPWLELEKPELGDQDWYSDDFWDEYHLLMKDDKKRYEDLFKGQAEYNLHYGG